MPQGHKKRVSYLHRDAQPDTLASVKTWGIYGELVVKDSPAAKLQLFFYSTKFFSFHAFNTQMVKQRMVGRDIHVFVFRKITHSERMSPFFKR